MTRISTSVPFKRQPFPRPSRTPRVMLRAKGSADRRIDGIWWPRTDNLTTELHDLIAAVTGRTGPVSQISFDWSELSRRQRLIEPDDGVRLCDSSPGQPSGVMFLFGRSGRLSLYVVPAGTVSDEVDRLIREVTASDPDFGE